MPISNPSISEAQVLLSYKAADQSVNNTEVLVDATGLSIQAEANKDYDLFMSLIVNSNITPDIKILFTLPAGAAIVGVNNGLIGESDTGTAIILVEGDYTAAKVLSTTSLDRKVLFWLFYTGAAAAGNIQLQFAQQSAHASDTFIRAGSFIKAVKLN